MDAPGDVSAELVRGAGISRAVRELVGGARGEVVAFAGPPGSPLDLSIASLARGGVRVRVLRAATAATSGRLSAEPAGQNGSRPSGSGPNGLEVRTTRQVPLPYVVADGQLALLALDTEFETAALLRSPTAARGLRALFDATWDAVGAAATAAGPPTAHVGAGPVGPAEADGEPELTHTQRRMLELMASGLKDEAIARQLGTSVRTLRRHVTALEQQAGVDNRVALAVAAVRRGWLR